MLHLDTHVFHELTMTGRLSTLKNTKEQKFRLFYEPSCIFFFVDIFGELSTSDEDDEKDVNVLDSEDDASKALSMFKMDESSTSMMAQPEQFLNMSGLVMANDEVENGETLWYHSFSLLLCQGNIDQT